MKHLLLLFNSILILVSCGSTYNIDPVLVENLVEKNEFTFVAKRAQPSSNSVQNIMVGLPNFTNSQLFQLNDGYTLRLSKDSLSADLPYFGIARNIGYGSDNQGIKFSTTDFEIVKSLGKKNRWNYKIHPKHVNSVNFIFIEIYPNGGASISLNFNDRQPIGFDGYIEQK